MHASLTDSSGIFFLFIGNKEGTQAIQSNHEIYIYRLLKKEYEEEVKTAGEVAHIWMPTHFRVASHALFFHMLSQGLEKRANRNGQTGVESVPKSCALHPPGCLRVTFDTFIAGWSKRDASGLSSCDFWHKCFCQRSQGTFGDDWWKRCLCPLMFVTSPKVKKW